jgi:hypothetical protein
MEAILLRIDRLMIDNPENFIKFWNVRVLEMALPPGRACRCRTGPSIQNIGQLVSSGSNRRPV